MCDIFVGSHRSTQRVRASVMDPLSASNYTSTSNKGREPAVLPRLRAVAAIAASNLFIGAGAFDGDVGRLSDKSSILVSKMAVKQGRVRNRAAS